MSTLHTLKLKVNGKEYERQVEARLLLSDFLRHDLKLTGTHVGCEHGICGACTILMDGVSTRSCLVFAIQANGHELETVESLGTPENMHPLQKGFKEAHALQCGFCTPGILMSLMPFLEKNNNPTDEEIREAIDGNLCRCTGYENMIEAVRIAAEEMYPGQKN